MDVAQAFEVLGLRQPCQWEDVRQSYRDRLRAHHPDVSSGPDAAAQTDAVVAAFRVLRDATQDGLHPLPLVEQPISVLDDGEIAPLVLYAPPGDVFSRIVQAAHRIGELSYADRETMMLQVTISDPAWAPAQLTAELTPDGDCTTALFSLEPLGVGDAPPINAVVEKLASELRSPSALD